MEGSAPKDPTDWGLWDRGKVCLKAFQDLLDLTKNPPGLPRPTNSETLKYLEEKKKSVEDLINKYQLFCANVGRAPYSSDKQAVQRTTEKINILIGNVSNAKEVLTHRINLRRLHLHFSRDERTKAEEEFDKLVKKLDDGIQHLHTRTTSVQRRDSRKNSRQSPRARYCEILLRLKEKNEDLLLVFRQPMLWDVVTEDEELKYHICNSLDPGDGKTYQEVQLLQAETELRALYQGWADAFGENSTQTGPYSLVKGIKDLPRYKEIFVILKHIQHRECFVAFLRHGKYTLPLDMSDIEIIAKNQDPTFTQMFCAEQYRMRGRTWPEPFEIVYLDSMEPHPYTIKGDLGQGSFGVAHRVMDIFSKDHAVHKRQRYNTEDVRKHFKIEIDILNRLRNVKHVVQLKRAYCRGGQYAIVVEFGYESLRTQLIKLGRRMRQRQSHGQGLAGRKIEADEHFSSAVFNIFGCLSSGLARIHAEDIRHKDIKPANIIYNFKDGIHDFFFIDFSVAYDFKNDVDSHSKPQKRYSQRWAAPEVMKKETGTASRWGQAPIDVDEDLVKNVGRKADVYSLGIVFLEILSVLMGEEYREEEDDKVRVISSPKSLEACAHFYAHLPAVEKWIRACIKHLKQTNAKGNLIPLFELSSDMIQQDPEKRPTAKTAALRLAEVRRVYFCNHCLTHQEELKNLPDNY